MTSPDPPWRVRRPVMYQTWSWLTFLHWSYDPETVQRMALGSLGDPPRARGSGAFWGVHGLDRRAKAAPKTPGGHPSPPPGTAPLLGPPGAPEEAA